MSSPLAEAPDHLVMRTRWANQQAKRTDALLAWCAERGFTPSLLDLAQERERRRLAALSQAMAKAVRGGG